MLDKSKIDKKGENKRMDNVTKMIKREEGSIFNFIDYVVVTTDLEQGVDFEVVSMTVMNKDFELMSLGMFTGMPSSRLFEKYNFHDNYLSTTRMLLNNIGNSKNVVAVDETQLPDEADENFVFYKFNEPVDIDLATELGLGVVKMKDDEFLLYSPFYGQDEQWDNLDEMLMLKVYFQLKHPETYDWKLENTVIEHVDLIESVMVANVEKHINQLKKIFSSHKK
jgi:hypothetical protein